MSHTAGPWEISEVETVDGHPMVVGGSEYGFGLIADVTLMPDARLIAAAPDLLAVARECLELAKLAGELTGCRGDDEYVWGIEDRLNAVIAKAEGR